MNDEKSSHPEFYSFLMTNPSTSYGILEIQCFGTKLYSHQYAVLDSGRYLTVVPEWGFIGDRLKGEETYSYKYFITGSLDYTPHMFLSADDHDAVWARNRLYSGVIIYENELEKEMFEEYLHCNMSQLQELIGSEDDLNWNETTNEREREFIQRKIHIGETFVSLLEDYRKQVHP